MAGDQANTNSRVGERTLPDKARPRGRYPHIKRAGDFLFVSGLSSRRADNTFDGADEDQLGNVSLDIRIQTRSVLENMRDVLASEGAGLADLVQVTCFLANMNDFAEYNEAYGEFFANSGPTRTTVAVDRLPHHHILIEINGIAYATGNP